MDVKKQVMANMAESPNLAEQKKSPKKNLSIDFMKQGNQGRKTLVLRKLEFKNIRHIFKDISVKPRAQPF